MYDPPRTGALTRAMDRRPLTLFAAAYACGAAAQASLGAGAQVCGALLIASAAAWALARRRVLAFSCALFLGATLTALALRTPDAETMRGAEVQARVASVRGEGDIHEGFRLERATINGEGYPYRIDAYAYGGVETQIGDTVRFTATLYAPDGVRNPGGIDEKRMLWKDGVALRASVDGRTFQRVRAGDGFFTALARLRVALAARIDALFGASAPLVKALTIGVRDALPSEIKADFRDMGIAHMLAISGLHIECLALFLDFILRKLRVPKKAAFFAIAAFFGFYACLVGLGPSIVRAAVMYVMLRAAPLMGRPSDGMTRLSAAFLLLVLIKPLNVFDYGFVLSFSAVAGLMLAMPPVSAWLEARLRGKSKARRALRRVAVLAAVSTVAQLATLPAVATYYGAISPWSVAANLVAVPLLMAVLPLSMAAIVLSYLFFPLGAAVALLPSYLLAALSALIAKMTYLPLARLALPMWPWYLSALYALAFALTSRYVTVPRGVRRAAPVALALIFLLSLGVRGLAFPTGLTVVFLDAGNADASVVFAEGAVYLIDAGDTDSPAADYLAYMGIGALDGVFLTHPHKDHVAGMAGVLAQARVDALYLGAGFDGASANDEARDAVRAAKEASARVEYLREGDAVQLSKNITLSVHQADEHPDGAPDDVSLIALIRYGEGSALFLADLPKEREKLPVPDADVLKVAHHGSRYNTSELLIASATPSVAVIPVGYNSYGHPSAELLERLDRAGAAVYRTDESGAITARIRMDGSVEIQTYIETGK
jgi:competence protein ComEC